MLSFSSGFRFIGLTGGIACGKSTCTKYFVENKIPVIDFDDISRWVVLPGSSALKSLVKAFGSEILNADGSLNREKLGGLIFKDPSKRKVLNDIMKMPIQLEFLKRAVFLFFTGKSHLNAPVPIAAGLRNILGGTKLIVLDAPLLFEFGLSSICSEVISVIATDAVQEARLMARDKITTEAAQARIKSQMPNAKKASLSNKVLNNDGTVEQQEQQLESVHNHLLQQFCLRASIQSPEPSYFYYCNPLHWCYLPTVTSSVLAVLVGVGSYFNIKFFERFMK